MNQQYPSILLEKAVGEFSKLPGIGRKTAMRLVLHLLRQDTATVEAFGNSIITLKREVKYCKVCHNISDTETCQICANPQREQMTNLFVLIDSRLEPQKIDLEFMEWLGENGIPFSIIFTKADKLKGGRLKMNINAYLRELGKQWEELPPHFVSSSEDRTGRIDILNYIENINKDLNVK